MNVNQDDIIHCDAHGAVVVPAETVKAIPAAVDLLVRRERLLLDACKSKGDTLAALRDALTKMSDIH
jgi:regulator of RNase E activity RraA